MRRTETESGTDAIIDGSKEFGRTLSRFISLNILSFLRRLPAKKALLRIRFLGVRIFIKFHLPSRSLVHGALVVARPLVIIIALGRLFTNK
jgi:hypothetical protein